MASPLLPLLLALLATSGAHAQAPIQCAYGVTPECPPGYHCVSGACVNTSTTSPASSSSSSTSGEVLIPLPNSAGHIALSTRGASAFRVRFLFGAADKGPIDTPMVSPSSPDAPFTALSAGTGITSPLLGSVEVDPATGVLSLRDASGRTLTSTNALGGGGGKPDLCAARPGTDIGGGTRAGPPSTVADQAACCATCKATAGCTNWVFGHPGDAEGNCWVLSSISGAHASAGRTLGGANLGSSLTFTTAAGSALYGRGGGAGDGTQLALGSGQSVSPHVANKETYVPYYYALGDGYGAMGVVNRTTGSGKTNYFPAGYSTDGAGHVSWTGFDAQGKEPFEMYVKYFEYTTAVY